MPLFNLPPLPYALDALSPCISKDTMNNHYHRHHQTYIDKLNAFVEADQQWQGLSLEAIIVKAAHGPVFNNAAQHWNHNLFWQCLAPANSQKPSEQLAKAIDQYFGGMDALLARWKDEAAKRFGSGWVWLVQTHDGALEVRSTPNAENPLTMENVARTLLACDVWEHAYYLDTQYNRPLYVDQFWQVVAWDFVSKQLQGIA